MTKDETLKLALQTIERSVATCFDEYSHEQVMSRPENFINQTITAIEKALTQPQKQWIGLDQTTKPDIRHQTEAFFAGVQWAETRLKELNS